MDTSQIHENVIIHVDVDCFYAQVEMMKNPNLINKPLGIKQRQIIVTCNYLAREFGVTKLMTVKDALGKCPNLVMVLGEDLTDYRAMSEKIHQLLKGYTNKVERLGMDENYLDVTDIVCSRLEESNLNRLKVVGHTFKLENAALDQEEACNCGCQERLTMGSSIAFEIREALKNQLNITCCAGVSHNKLLAKLISGYKKPNQQTTIFTNDVTNLMLTIEFPRQLPGIGSKMSETLNFVNIKTLKDLQKCKISDIKILGKDAERIKNYSFGVDNSPVVESMKHKQYGLEDTTPTTTLENCKKSLEKLIARLYKMVIEDGRIPKTIVVFVRRKFIGSELPKRRSQRCSIPSCIHLFRNGSNENNKEVTENLLTLAIPMLKNLAQNNYCFGLLGVTLTNLVERNNNQNAIENFFHKKCPEIGNSIAEAALIKDNVQPSSMSKTTESNDSEKKSTQIENSALEPGLDNMQPINMSESTEVNDSSKFLKIENNISEASLIIDNAQPSILNESTKSNGSAYSNNTKTPQPSRNSIMNYVFKGEKFFMPNSVNSGRRLLPGKSPIAKRKKVDPKLPNTRNIASLLTIPYDVDKSVFYSLPKDVQNEYVLAWKAQKTN